MTPLSVLRTAFILAMGIATFTASNGREALSQDTALNAPQTTLSTLTARGRLNCSPAVHLATPREYSQPGTIAGFDRDFCRAIAAAVLKDKSKINFVQLIPQNRFQALQEGAIDVLIRSTTWTLSRDSSLGVHFAGVNFYDGQGFIAHANLGVKTLGEAMKSDEVNVCAIGASSSALVQS